jgi:hypothetical protein
MTKRGQKVQSDFRHTWYFRDWAALAEKTQAQAIRDLGWSRAKASDVWGGQPYSQAIIDEVAPWLGVQPYELLIPVSEAMALRRLRESAATIAAAARSHIPAGAFKRT